MTMQAAGGIFIPPYNTEYSGTYVESTIALDAAADRYGMVFSCPRDGEISHILLPIGTVTGTGTAADMLCRLETVSSGTPSGTLKDVAAGQGTFTIDPDTDDNQTMEVAAASGSNTVTVSEGDVIAAFVEVSALNGAGTINIPFDPENSETGFPVGVADITGVATWVIQSTSHNPLIGIKYQTDGYVTLPGVRPAFNLGEDSWSSSNSPDHRGNALVLPYPVQVSGYWWRRRTAVSATLKLLNASGTEIGPSITVDPANVTLANGIVFIPFDPVTLSANTEYHVVVRPTTTTSIILPWNQVSTAAHRSAGGYSSSHLYKATAHTGSLNSWTPDSTIWYHIGLYVTGFDDGAGGGGGGAGFRPLGVGRYRY